MIRLAILRLQVIKIRVTKGGEVTMEKKTKKGRPQASWQRKLLALEDYRNKEISLSQVEKITGTNRRAISQALSKIVRSRREAMYNAKDLYQAIKKKLEEGNI